VSYIDREEIFSKKLNEIGGIKFTPREIDIIACIIHNRGDKKIATLLVISPRTVETHIRSIMQKLGNNSREYIIDLVRKSGKLQCITKYYLHLLAQNLFERQLQKIRKIINRQDCSCLLHYTKINKNEEDLLKRLKEHLKTANITLINREDKDQATTGVTHNLCIFEKELVNDNKLNASIVLIVDKNLNPLDINAVEYIDFRQEEDYYLSTLRLIKKILNKTDLDQIIKEFKAEYQNMLNAHLEEEDLKDKIIPTSQSIVLKEKLLSRKFIILLMCISCFSILVVWIISNNFFVSDKIITQNIRSDFIIPHKSTLLERSSIIAEIKEKLNDKDNMQTVVLIGTGGAGKTTLARLYASKQNANVTWEINAETKDSIMNSFENLGYALSQTAEQKQELKTIQEIQDFDKKQARLVLFIRNKLKIHPNWLLIYDNVETFSDIKDYFPYDQKAWGSGQIIITTRNSTIANNSYVSGGQVIFLEELSHSEQFDLFTKILNSEDRYNYSTSEQERTLQFLQNIPPLPLDVTTAAYYIKEIGITYEEYLNRKEQCSEEFAVTQGEIIKEKSSYIKNRYGIITLSLKHLMEQEPSFSSLLLLISMVDSQNIPRSLLDSYKGKISVDNFLHNLSKYTIINKNCYKNNTNSTFSLHRSTQAIILHYLTKVLNLNKNSQLIESIATTLETYIDRILEVEDIIIIKQLFPHLTSFLEKNLVNELTKSHLTSKLGHIYWSTYLNGAKAVDSLKQALRFYKSYYKTPNPRKAYTLGQLGIAYKMLGNRKKEQEYLEKSLALYQRYYGEEKHIEIAWLLVNLASFYRKVDYQKTQEYFERGLAIYKDYYGENDIKTSWVLGNLGRFYRSFGNYKKAKDLLEQTITIQQNNEAKNQIEYAWLVINLGIVHQNLGNNEKAKKLIKKGLSFYKETLEDEHIEVAWSRIHLAIVYGNLGNWSRAKQLIQKSLGYYIQHYGKDHDEIAWALEKLGVTYRELGDFISANNIFNQSLILCKKYYGINSAQVAFLLHNIGKTKILEGDLTIAEEYLNQSLAILQNKRHPKAYRVLESLIDLYKKRTIYEEQQGDIKQSQIYYTKAKYLINKLLSILKDNFPEDSSYIKKINLEHGEHSKAGAKLNLN
jgi:DNA-binding CsgD family transcriptional regulator